MPIARHPPIVTKIVSGGQTGVDRAALDAALALSIPCGGWCPAGRRAEDGVIDARYPLTETPNSEYPQRTEWNVRDSDGTLIIANGPLIGGTMFTQRLAAQYKKPCWVIQVNEPLDAEAFQRWAKDNAIGVLNVAGPRESRGSDIYKQAKCILDRLLRS